MEAKARLHIKKVIETKRHGNIYHKICDWDNLLKAHKKARRGKGWYKEVQMVDSKPDLYIGRLQESLINKTYRTSEYSRFIRYDKGKEREIYRLPYYPDRICQWAIMLQVEHIIINTLIYDTYASIPERGIHVALDRVNQAMVHREGTRYCLKLDIKKYFPSVDQEILKALLRRKFKDRDLLWLLDEIIDSAEAGIPIGNYLSQYLANFYLAYFDHWLKGDKEVKYYFRYMDDIVILSDDKKRLHSLKRDIDSYLNDKLNLQVKGNWQVFPTYVRGVDFVGYRSFGDYILLRKSTAKNIKSKIRSINKRPLKPGDVNSVMSYKGWLKYCNSYNLQKRYLDPVIRRMENEGAIECNA